MRIIHDYYNRNDPSTIYLATPNKDILCALNSIDATSVDFVGKCNDLSTLTFTINRYTENSKGDRIKANGYELVSKYMRLYVTNVGWFIMDTPEIHSTGNIEHKTINASSAEIEFKQIPLDTWKVNKGTTDSLEMLVDGNVEEIDGVEFAKENIKFHNPKNKKLSLVDILVSKVYGWEVGYVDPIPKIYESFENGELVKTPVLLANEVGMFDISYSNAYAFMMQDLEKFFNCVVEFDYINFKVNFYRVENFGKDTSVTIGFRNVQNTSDITVDEDNIFTKFRVVGGNNLGIEQFNGGSNYLIMLDKYWLNEKYLSPTTIDKYNKWSSFCNIARYKYGEYSKEWNVLQEQIGELNTRVPNLDCNPENWDKLSDEELLNFKSDYEAQKLGYEKIYVDEEGHFDIDALNASPDANIYHQIVDTILPNIDIEIENRKLPTSEGETDFIETYKTTWEYYGVNELEIKLTSYQDIINVLKKSHYDLTWERYQELSKLDNEKYPTLTQDGFKDKHDEYLKNAYQLDESNTDSCAYALKERKKEVSEKETKQKEIGNNRNILAQKMGLETWRGQTDISSPESEGFSDKELNEIYHIINQTTYTNENIFTTSLDNLSENVDIQQKLCETALEDIAVYSLPQTIYSTTLDNILSAAGNELHANDLNYGNFIRVGIRDDYYVKLRVMAISFNPCLYDNKFSLQFSNMIKSGKKRNDFVSLLDMAGNLSNSSANTSFSGSVNLSDDNIYQILSKILQSSLFSNKIQNIINGTDDATSGTIIVQSYNEVATNLSSINLSETIKSGHFEEVFKIPDTWSNSTNAGVKFLLNNVTGTVRFSNLKLELGNKPTDWSPAPEDVQSSLNSSENKSNNALEQTSEVRSSLEILKNSIETLVTDENGQSLMTQTGNGWTFNMGAYQTIIDKVTSDITDVKGDVDEVNQLANNASQLANDVATKTAYINMSTDDTGSPCIELGKSDNEFKLRITNTSIDFMQGSQKIAYITNQSLYIQSSVVTDEMKVGDESGYIWKKRSNGNMGLRYVS